MLFRLYSKGSETGGEDLKGWTSTNMQACFSLHLHNPCSGFCGSPCIGIIGDIVRKVEEVCMAMEPLTDWIPGCCVGGRPATAFASVNVAFATALTSAFSGIPLTFFAFS